MDHEAKALVARMRMQREFGAWQVWTTAQLTRVDPKYFPKLADFLRMARGERPRQQSTDEMIAIAQRWAKVVKQL